ncbi:SseB family protein [Microbacterium sp. H83]|uniref:SseB family protein n=1 Tax=Microbacterium sp. H83 TaxID=1827324 RepID=UPI0007F4E3B6|nr:SseB family protein [Microbacterium sp. H83]OAN42101.1 hypothetical protein A4X16_10225 [Microbacterium sp. H83]
MALFSRRKKSDDDVVAESTDIETASASETEESSSVGAAAATDTPAAEEAEATPTIGISVQAFRGVGAQAGPEISLPDPDVATGASTGSGAITAPGTPPTATAPAPERRLPLAPALPPEQTETVAGMKDNVLLRESLKEVEKGATNEQLLGVLRQALQGHLYIRVNGDARAQISEGKPLSVAVVRDGDRQFMLGFSSAAAVRDSVQLEKDPTATSAVAQPVTSVLQQVVAGDFAGLIVDNASAPHRVVFPTELLQKALEQADVDMTIKSIIAAPREQDSTVRLGEALALKRTWVAVNDGGETGQVGIAEAQTPDGKRFLQLFSHPLEIIALGRGDRPLPFDPEQLAKTLATHPEMAGIIIDPAGPSMVIERDALAPVLALDVASTD